MNNPPAFPSGNEVTLGDLRSSGHSGMTLRDYMAAKAMQALIDNDGLFSEIPRQAYAIADAMMKEREQ